MQTEETENANTAGENNTPANTEKAPKAPKNNAEKAEKNTANKPADKPVEKSEQPAEKAPETPQATEKTGSTGQSVQLPYLGARAIMNLTDEQRKKLGGNHFVGDLGRGSTQAPATIVAVWGIGPDCACNLKVHGDSANNDLWVTSATRGDEPGNWNWPA